MGFFTRMMSYLTLGSTHPIRRLAAYYLLLVVVGLLVFASYRCSTRCSQATGSIISPRFPRCCKTG